MISFRYHLVTIVAVFLALGVGLLAGTTVVDQGLVNRLKEQTSSANRAAEQMTEQRDELRRQLDRSGALTDEAIPLLTADRLLGERVIIVGDQSVDAPVEDEAKQTVEGAGADVTATLALTPRFALGDEKAKAAMAEIVGMPGSSAPAELEREAVAQLAARLSEGPSGGDDLLLLLLDGGFLEAGGGSGLKKVGGVLPDVGGSGQSVIVASDARDASTQPPGDSVVPLAQALVRQGVATAAVEGSAARTGFVSTLREWQPPEGRQLLTVDNVDEPTGRISLVVGLDDLLSGVRGGNYGIKPGRDSLFPSLSR